MWFSTGLAQATLATTTPRLALSRLGLSRLAFYFSRASHPLLPPRSCYHRAAAVTTLLPSSRSGVAARLLSSCSRCRRATASAPLLSSRRSCRRASADVVKLPSRSCCGSGAAVVTQLLSQPPLSQRERGPKRFSPGTQGSWHSCHRAAAIIAQLLSSRGCYHRATVIIATAVALLLVQELLSSRSESLRNCCHRSAVS